MSGAAKLRPGVVSVIEYKTRDLGHGYEYDIIDGYWTGGIDAWGKRMIKIIGGGEVYVYLFDDEIKSVDPLVESFNRRVINRNRR